MKKFLIHLFYGFLSFSILTALIFLIKIDLRYFNYLTNQFVTEFYIVVLLGSILIVYYTNNERIKIFFKSLLYFYFFTIIIAISVSLLYFNDQLSERLSLVISILTTILIWFLLLKSKNNIKKYLSLITLFICILLFADLINMHSMFSSIKTIEYFTLKDFNKLETIDTDSLHYSIYSKIDTLNLSELAHESSIDILPPLPYDSIDSLAHYDVCEIHKAFYTKLYFSISDNKKRTSIRKFDWLKKFFKEYYITHYFDRVYYLKHRKTQKFIK